MEWFSDTSEAAQKARQEEEFRSMQSHAAAAAAAAVSTTETGAGGVVDAKVNEIMDKKTGAPGKLGTHCSSPSFPPCPPSAAWGWGWGLTLWCAWRVRRRSGGCDEDVHRFGQAQTGRDCV